MGEIFRKNVIIRIDDVIDNITFEDFKTLVRDYVSDRSLDDEKEIIEKSLNLDNSDYLELINDYWLRDHIKENIDFYIEKEEAKETIECNCLPDLNQKEKVRRFLIDNFAPEKSYDLPDWKLANDVFSYLQNDNYGSNNNQ